MKERTKISLIAIIAVKRLLYGCLAILLGYALGWFFSLFDPTQIINPVSEVNGGNAAINASTPTAGKPTVGKPTAGTIVNGGNAAINASTPAGIILNTGTGYYCDAKIPPGDMVKSFHTTWVVPSNPRGKIFFYVWNGLNGGNMQPVLRWVQSHWDLDLCTFYPKFDRAADNIVVKSGDKLEGVIELISSSPGAYYTYKVYFIGYPREQICTCTNPATSFAECLEAYTKTTRDFPADEYIKMTDIYYITTDGRKVPVPNWTTRPGEQTTPSGKNTVIKSNGLGGADVYFYLN